MATSTAPVEPVCFSFAAAGWLQMYLFGVGKALQECGIAELIEKDAVNPEPSFIFAGSSAGSLAASALVVNVDFVELCEYAVACSKDCRARWSNAFKISKYLQDGVQMFATEKFEEETKRRNGGEEPGPADQNPVARALSRHYEAYTTLLPGMQKKAFTEFSTVEDVEEAILASCRLVPLAGGPYRLRSGEWSCDGGLRAFQPRKGEPRTICVSPLYFSSAHIRPSKFVPVWWGLYPPSEAQYRQLFTLGYRDAMGYMAQQRIVPALRPPTLPSSLSTPRGGSSDAKKKSIFCAKVSSKAELLANQRTVGRMIANIAVTIAILCIFRPLSVMLIYGEMGLVYLTCLVSTFFHEVIPHALDFVVSSSSARSKHKSRLAAMWDLYLVTRNLISFRVMMHLFFGSWVPINVGRLERYSRVYRFAQPFL